MKNKKIVLAVVALALVLALFVTVYLVTRPEAAQGSKAITVTVVHSDGKSVDFTYKTDAETLGEVLYAAELIQAEGVDSGMFNIVDGEKADWNENQSYWALYEGTEYAMEGVDTLLIQDGDSFKLEYTIG